MSKTHFYESKPKYNKFSNNTRTHQKKTYYTIDPIEKEETKEPATTSQCPKFTNSKTSGIKLKPAPEYKPKALQ